MKKVKKKNLSLLQGGCPENYFELLKKINLKLLSHLAFQIITFIKVTILIIYLISLKD